MNTKTKQFTNMTASWFAKLRKRQLISAKPYNEEVWDNNAKLEKKPVVVKKEERFEDKVIRELRELTPAEAFAVQVKIGRTPEALAKDLERLYRDENDHSFTQEYVNRVCREMTIARGCYLTIQGKIGSEFLKTIF